MPTLVYSPGVEIHIDTHKAGTLDVSPDIVEGSVTLRENALHGTSFTLLNGRRKYDGIFTPNDRVTVRLKRLRWVLVMSGYLNAVPYFSIFPRSITLTASCALKKVQYWLFDPGTTAYRQLLATQPGEEELLDIGIGMKIVRVLTQVANWPAGNIHIGGIPGNWRTRMQDLKNETKDLIDWDAITLQATFANGTINPGSGGSGDLSNASQDIDFFLAAVREHESGGNYQSHTHSGGGASGAYQMIKSTWQSNAAGISGYPEAYLAPANEQDAVARGMASRVFATYQDWKKVAIWWYYPAWANDPTKWGQVPAPGAGNRQTVGQYGDIIVARMGELKNTVGAGQSPTSMPSDFMGGVTSSTTQTGSTPTPNSAQLIAVGRTQKGKPYYNAGPARFGPDEFDCSGFVWWCHDQIGFQLPKTVSDTYFAMATSISVEEALNTPGAIVGQSESGNNGHIAISIGDGKNVVQAGGGKHNVNEGPFTHSSGAHTVGGKFVGMHYIGGPNGDTTLPGGLGGGNSANSPLNVFFPVTVGQQVSDFYGGLRATMNDTSLLQDSIEPLVMMGMRSYCCAPNGDFIAWFPDYFDQYDILGKMVIRPIELKDFTITWDDTFMKTHEFVTGAMVPGFISDQPTGTTIPAAEGQTAGIATIEIPQIMEAIFNWAKQPDSRLKELLSDPQAILDRFGARKEWTKIMSIQRGEAELWMAIRLFIKNWAQMFNTVVPTTWMPEIFPGMILKFPDYGIQAYVTEVTHNFNFESGGFTTDTTIIAPSNIDGTGMFVSLPSAVNV